MSHDSLPVLLTIILIDETEPICYHIISHHYHHSPNTISSSLFYSSSSSWHHLKLHWSHFTSVVTHSLYSWCDNNNELITRSDFCLIYDLVSTTHEHVDVITCPLLTTYHCWEIQVETCLAALAFVNWLLCNCREFSN